MKKLLILAILISTLTAFGQSTKEYAKISGKILNYESGDIKIYEGNDICKTIQIASDGTFSDTLLIANRSYKNFIYQKVYIALFLKKGSDLLFTIDANKPYEHVKFTGKDSETNNYISQQTKLSLEVANSSLYFLDKKVFKKEMNNVLNNFFKLKEEYKNADALVLSSYSSESIEANLKWGYKNQQVIIKKNKSLRGKPAPEFHDFKNSKGGVSSLKDFRGKFVCIDVWGTRCSPCMIQIPYFKKIEEKYHGKNIVFIGIAVDEQKSYDRWQAMIKKKKMNGVQLLIDNFWDSQFLKDYGIEGIPRFVIIDPKGNFIDAIAPNPSNVEFEKILKSLNL
jgi:thiol-disulfide isomerase/thioredoxin